MTNPKNPDKKNKRKNKYNINLHITNDISNNIIMNPCFDHLQHSKGGKNTIISFDKEGDKQNYINKRSLLFIMKFNKKKSDNDSYKKIITALDNTIDVLNPYAGFRATKKEEDINLLLKKLNILYNNWDSKKIITHSKKPINFRFSPKNQTIQPWYPKTLPKIWGPPPLPPPPFPPPIQSIDPFINITRFDIDREINGLSDILRLIKDYPLKLDIKYNINMKALHDIKKPLEDLNKMIGMQALKDSIVDQIVFFAQDLHKDNDFMHTVIYGPPGTGKTEIAKIMGEIFSSIGILKKNKFRKVTRSDLIAGYLGQTAIKTRDVINDCLGGVLFIDEAYALGNREKRDSFAKECIDTLCEALSDNKEQLMVIIAGYEEDLDKCFFAYNQGLNSRFPWRFHTNDYKANELNLIFQKKVKEIGWSLKNDIADEWFEEKMEYFKYFGRDIETLLAKIKIAHGRRVFCKAKSEKTILIEKDINRGFEMFIDNNEVKQRKGMKNAIPHMYI
jgi:AAA+ superfamily predicted ATPase